MLSEKRIPFTLSLVVGVLMAGFFISAYGGLKTFFAVSVSVSWLHYWYGVLLIVVVFWLGFVGTWAAYAALLWFANRYIYNPGDKNVD